MNEEEVVVVGDDNNGDVFLSSGASDESNISYSQIAELTVDNIDIYEPAFIGFGVVGSACLMCYGMIVIIHLFRRVM